MIIRQQLHIISLSIFTALTGFCQAPPLNDNFDDRTALSGSSVSFSAGLANATTESGEVAGPSGYPAGPSVWWTWTASTSSQVVITMSRDWSAGMSADAVFEVFTGSVLPYLERLDYNIFDAPATRYVSFNAVAGSNYQFRASGTWPGTLNFQLTASPVPQILVQPSGRSISSHGSATFYVIAAGMPAPGYQWLSNGVPIAGQTGPILTVENVVSNTPCNYSVLVTNSGGSVESAPAALRVLQADPVPLLSALRPTTATELPFTLKGEQGRWYRFRITWDFVDWFDIAYGLNTNQTTTFSVYKFPEPQQFVGACLNYETDICAARLQALRAAIDMLAIDHKLKTLAPYTLDDLVPYFPGGNLPSCPQRGGYMPGATITNEVSCTFASQRGHIALRESGFKFPGLIADVMMFGGTFHADSYDSSDTNYSTLGMYDRTKASDQCLIETAGSGFALGGNAVVAGYVASGPAGTVNCSGSTSVGDKAWTARNTKGIQPGHRTNNCTVAFAQVQAPYTNGVAPPSGTVEGTNYDYVLEGRYYAPVLNSNNYGATMYVKATSSLYVTGYVSLSKIVFAPGAHLDLYAGAPYLTFTPALVGATAPQFTIFALPSCLSLTLNSQSMLYGLIYAPDTDLVAAGGAQIAGSIIGKSFRCQGTFDFHFDLALSK